MRNLGIVLIVIASLAGCGGSSEKANTAADTVASPAEQRGSGMGTSSTSPIAATGTPTTTTTSISTPTETTSTVITRTTKKKGQ